MFLFYARDGPWLRRFLAEDPPALFPAVRWASRSVAAPLILTTKCVKVIKGSFSREKKRIIHEVSVGVFHYSQKGFSYDEGFLDSCRYDNGADDAFPSIG